MCVTSLWYVCRPYEIIRKVCDVIMIRLSLIWNNSKCLWRPYHTYVAHIIESYEIIQIVCDVIDESKSLLWVSDLFDSRQVWRESISIEIMLESWIA